jgi:hypothetical protein
MRRHTRRSLLTIVILGVLGIATGLAVTFLCDWFIGFRFAAR